MANGLAAGDIQAVTDQLLELSDTIVIGSLALHMLFGGVMGFAPD